MLKIVCINLDVAGSVLCPLLGTKGGSGTSL